MKVTPDILQRQLTSLIDRQSLATTSRMKCSGCSFQMAEMTMSVVTSVIKSIDNCRHHFSAL
jgi:hypothetical protein